MIASYFWPDRDKQRRQVCTLFRAAVEPHVEAICPLWFIDQSIRAGWWLMARRGGCPRRSTTRQANHITLQLEHSNVCGDGGGAHGGSHLSLGQFASSFRVQILKPQNFDRKSLPQNCCSSRRKWNCFPTYFCLNISTPLYVRMCEYVCVNCCVCAALSVCVNGCCWAMCWGCLNLFNSCAFLYYEYFRCTCIPCSRTCGVYNTQFAQLSCSSLAC